MLILVEIGLFRGDVVVIAHWPRVGWGFVIIDLQLGEVVGGRGDVADGAVLADALTADLQAVADFLEGVNGGISFVAERGQLCAETVRQGDADHGLE